MVKTLCNILVLLCSLVGHAQTITTVAGNGIGGYGGDTGSPSLAQLFSPTYVALDTHGNIFIADFRNSVIRKIQAPGIIVTIAGTGIAGYSGDGGAATNAKLGSPIGIAIDNSDNIFITDLDNNVIRKIHPSGIITTTAGTGSAGYSGDGGVATAAKLASPYGIVTDEDNNILFSDAGNKVVRKISSSGVITTIAGCGTLGYSGDGGPATDAKLSYPQFLAIHPKTKELYIADHANSTVRKINTDGTIATVAGIGGSPGNSGDGGSAISARLNSPYGLCFDTSGNLYIADILAHVIRKVNPTGIISTIAGTGVAGYNGEDNLATNTQLKGPSCGAFDKWGNLYFTDVYGHRVQRINYNTSAVYDVATTPHNITIYPNPVITEVMITADVTMKEVLVTDMLGRIVIRNEVDNKEVSLNVAQLPVGIYIVKVNGVYARKFTKE